MSIVPEVLTERHRLRQELTVKYREQADIVRLYGVPSAEKTEEIVLLRKDLAKVDKKSIGKDDDRKNGPKRSPKPKRFPWSCAYRDCGVSMPAGTAAINYRKRAYCSVICAHSDAASPPKNKTAKT